MNCFKDYYLQLSRWQQFGLNNIAVLSYPDSEQKERENDLVNIWQKQNFERRNLYTAMGERVYVKFPGWPDSQGIFRRAELLLGEPEPRLVQTDIYPGIIPDADKGYGIFLVDEKAKKTAPNVIFLSPRLLSKNTCRQNIETLDWHFLLRFVCLAGEARIILRMRNLLVDRQEFIYQGVVRAFGYGTNKERFSLLARTITWKELSSYLKKVPEELYPDFVRAVFFQAGNLFPKEFLDEETEDYRKYLKDILQRYFPNCPENVVENWDLKNCRPANYPWRRIAGFGYILSRLTEFEFDWEKLLENWLKQIASASSPRQLRQAGDFLINWFYLPVVPADYFASRYKFGKKSLKSLAAFLGRDRAASLVINVFLPAALYFARKRNLGELEDKLWKFYYSLPVLEVNRRAQKIWSKVLPQNLVEKNFLFNREVLNQGWLQIADDFCSQTTCRECVLPTILRRKIIAGEFR